MAGRITARRNAHARPVLEPLESRRLMSGSVAESEPNDTRAKADVIARDPDELVTVSGRVGTPADHDWFKIQLKAGDVLGVAVTGATYEQGGLDPYARLVDSSGRLVIENAGPNFTAGDALPAGSPLPRADRDSFSVEFYRVMPTAGTYYLDVSSYGGGSSGEYRMDVMVARPGMESAPRGARQVLFLDFDGATVDYGDFVGSPPVERVKLSPMRDSLEGFNLSRRNESAVIDAVVERVTKLLSDDVERDGLNGDYDRTGRAGEFDLEIRNSRDHKDTYGKDPFVSRVVIGGTQAEAGFVGDWDGVAGLAESLDVGNFKTDDQAVATLQWITDAVDLVSAQRPVTQVDLFALGVANIAAHEAGHIFGAVHTDEDPADGAAGDAQVMNPFIGEFIGPDFVLGTEDDLEPVMGVDGYNENEFFRGIDDTLNTIAFGLSTGTGYSRGSNHDEDDGDRRGGASAGNRDGDTAWSRLESMIADRTKPNLA